MSGNPRAFIDINGGYQTERTGADKEAHDAWVESNTWGLTRDDFIRLSYFHGDLEAGSNGCGPINGSEDHPGDVVYIHPEKGALTRSMVSHWFTDSNSFIHGYKKALERAATLPAGPAPTALKFDHRPSLSRAVAQAKAEMATWSPELRASVRLEGGDAAAPAGIPAFNPNAKCSPMLTQCPRCNNPHHACDQKFGVPLPAEQAPQPKLTLALPDYEKRRIVIASDEVIDGERVVCVAIETPTEQAGDVSFCTNGGTPMATYTPAKLDQDWEQAGELLPLPAYELVLIKQYMVGNYLSVYRGFQMHDYARAALAARQAPTDIEFDAWQRNHFASIMAHMRAAGNNDPVLSGMIQSAINGAYMAGRLARDTAEQSTDKSTEK